MNGTGSSQETGGVRRRRIGGLLVLLLLALAGLLAALNRGSSAEREATRWIRDYHRLAVQGTSPWPDWALSYPGQLALVRRLTRPESRIAGLWDFLRGVLPPGIRKSVPRYPGARQRLQQTAPILIQIPKMPAIRRALLESALDPRGANRRFAVQFACMDTPVPRALLPLLDQLAGDADAAVRVQVAVGVRHVEPRDPTVDRLLGRLQSDQVSAVREAARSAYPSDASDASLPPPSSHAAPSR
ncbi:MAG: hypothetical protein J0L84_15640 [Verrucomicrobia bacterium]|nr:hypothetical protein [Verrucomicrobiota bacterium]